VTLAVNAFHQSALGMGGQDTKGVHYLRSWERAAMSATNHRRPPQISSDEESAQGRDTARQLSRLLPEGKRPLRLVTDGDGREMISIPPGAVRREAHRVMN